MAVASSEVQSMGIETECEVCGTTIEIGIGWVDAPETGYIRASPVKGRHHGIVTDTGGLKLDV